MTTDGSRKIETVQNTCRIINALRDSGGSGITEIATSLDFSKSAVHGHLATLRDEGLVIKNGHTYRLSLRFLQIAEEVKNQIADYKIVKEEVNRLAQETGEVVHFGTEEQGRIVYLSKARGDVAVETASRIGNRMPMHSTSLGKAILAELPQERCGEIIDRYELSGKTDRTITTPERLRENLEETRQRSYAIDDEENIRGVRCIGMAVSAPDAGVMGALSISGPSKRMTDERMDEELEDKIAQAANVIEVNSRYS
ncbi:IclR family transcriptional regulator [Halorarum halobium]|uniref:IclR family transcriptional regulator n=1 Tax=Halorarum halobium TaxID=3075121 RepID=UPI0028B1E941|nr:IclR family transcriptional regulator [Halobaculum sp. XH14]